MVMENFKTVMKHQTALGYGALSLLAAGGEQLFSMVVFRCPCNAWSAIYSLVFLLVPALVLLLLGFLLSTRTWRMLTGCWAPTPGVRKRRCRFRLFGLLAAGASVAPLTWISVALLHASYYECLATGEQSLAPPWLRERFCQGREATCLQELHLMPCVRTPAAEEVLGYLRAESQVMGWILIATVMSLALISMCITRCRSPVSFLQLKFWKIYLDKEKQMFEINAKEHAAKLAERNIQSFFESTRPDPFYTPSIREWQQISSIYAFNANGQHYSMIHKYVEAANRNSTIKSAEGDGFPPIIMFVDGNEIGDVGL